MTEEKITIDIKKFVTFHKKRIVLLKKFLQEKIQGRLIYQISFLGFESLARILYQEEKDPKKRFIQLLSIKNRGISEKEAENLYKYWRCSLIHNGFIKSLWTTLESWNEDDESFLIFPNKFHSFTEFPPGSIVSIYESLINYFDNFFQNKNLVELYFFEK